MIKTNIRKPIPTREGRDTVGGERGKKRTGRDREPSQPPRSKEPRRQTTQKGKNFKEEGVRDSQDDKEGAEEAKGLEK